MNIRSVTPNIQSASGDADTLLAISWSLDLSDTRLVLERTSSPFTGAFYSKETFLDLFRGHRYRLLESSSSRVSYAGLNGDGSRQKESAGKWMMKVVAGVASLALTGDDGGAVSYLIQKGGRGFLKLDGRDIAWQRL